jgi:hypothetical protein
MVWASVISSLRLACVDLLLRFDRWGCGAELCDREMARRSGLAFRSELRGRCSAACRLDETAVPESEPELELELCRPSAVSRNAHDLFATSAAFCSFDMSSGCGITVGYMVGEALKWCVTRRVDDLGRENGAG